MPRCTVYNPTLSFFHSEEKRFILSWVIINDYMWFLKVNTFNVSWKFIWISLVYLEINLGKTLHFLWSGIPSNKLQAETYTEIMRKYFLQLSLVVSNDSGMLRLGAYTEACYQWTPRGALILKTDNRFLEEVVLHLGKVTTVTYP